MRVRFDWRKYSTNHQRGLSELSIFRNDASASHLVLGDVQQLIELGGPVVLVLLLASIFGFALVLRKALQFRRMSNSVFRKLHNAIDQWHEGQQQISLDALKTMNLSFADDLAYGLEHQQSQDKEQVRTELVRRAMNFLRDYRQGMRPLELIYYLAPVLGLLGTVLGMIDAFRGIAENANAGNEGATLAGGIWEALLTTAVGLTVAIFFTVLHSLLSSKLEKITLEISDLVERVQQ